MTKMNAVYTLTKYPQATFVHPWRFGFTVFGGGAREIEHFFRALGYIVPTCFTCQACGETEYHIDLETKSHIDLADRKEQNP